MIIVTTTLAILLMLKRAELIIVLQKRYFKIGKWNYCYYRIILYKFALL